MTTAQLPSSDALISGFPFPFADDIYRYSTNVEPAATPTATAAGQWGERVLDIDGEYHRELAERAGILAADPTRHTVQPHMRVAAWDTMLTLMRELASAYPESMSLTRDGQRWLWRNGLLGLSAGFAYGDESTLPDEPLRYIASQVQEDIVLLDHRGEMLYADAGVVTFAADWSFGFDVGMSFLEIHGPVPRIREEGVITRALEFLKRLQPHQPYRRTNWTMTIGRRLDVSTELYHVWGPDREMVQRVDDETFGRLVHLRVEVQHLIRLPESGAVLFLIRTYLLPLEELATVEPWRVRAASVLAELPQDMAEYKGISKYRQRASEWLAAHGQAPAGETPSSAQEAVSPPAFSLPRFAGAPGGVDPAGASFLIVAVGPEPETASVARAWVNEAEAMGPATLAVLDAMSDPNDRAVLDRLLARSKTGVRVMVVGGQYDLLQVVATARAAGVIEEEITAYPVHRRDLPVFCVHCRRVSRVEGEPGMTVACPGCARVLEIHPHAAGVRGSFLASDARARELA